MKFLQIALIIFCCLTASCTSNRHLNILNKNRECQVLLDSANIFIQTSESAIDIKPTIDDNQRNLRLGKLLQHLSFKNMSCLLESENTSLKALGFIYAVRFHRDSLLEQYSYLLSDTTTVQLFMADGRKSPKVKLGELLSAMSKEAKEDNDNFAKRPAIENIVSTFIKQYSAYPNSYKPISFPYFSMGSDNKGVTDFRIHHEYEIKNNDGDFVKTISAFVLDKNLAINVIEKDSSSTVFSFPLRLDYWLKNFGRQLTEKDSITLKLK